MAEKKNLKEKQEIYIDLIMIMQMQLKFELILTNNKTEIGRAVWQHKDHPRQDWFNVFKGEDLNVNVYDERTDTLQVMAKAHMAFDKVS